MYENNVYIKHYAEVKKYPGDIGVQLDQYDNAHGLKHNALLRAQYKHWRSIQTGVPELLSVEDKNDNLDRAMRYLTQNSDVTAQEVSQC